MQESHFTSSQFFRCELEVIRAGNHFRKTMIDCINDLWGEFCLENFDAWKRDQEEWGILQVKVQNDMQNKAEDKVQNKIDMGLSSEIKKLKKTSSNQRNSFYKKICSLLNRKEFETLCDCLQQANDLLEKLDKVGAGTVVLPYQYKDISQYEGIDTKLRQAWVELKAFNIERLSVEKHFQNVFTEWMSQLLNILPFWLPENSYAEFHKIKSIAATEQSLTKTIELRKILGQKIEFFLKNMLEQIKDKEGKNSEISDFCRKLNEFLQYIQVKLDAIKFESTKRSSNGMDEGEAWKLPYQKLHEELEIQRKKFFEQLAVVNKDNLEAITLYDMKQEDIFIVKYHIPHQSDFRVAKLLQHRIRALEKLVLQPDGIIHFDKPKPLLVIDWLEDKKDYSDLLFLLSIVSPEYLEDCLEQKISLYLEIVEDLQNQTRLFIEYWGEQTQAVIRSYRILGLYRRWEETLKESLNKLGIVQNGDKENNENKEVEKIQEIKEDEETIELEVDEISEIQKIEKTKSTDWTTLLALERLFTYEKKIFFNEAFKKENTIQLFIKLTKLMDSKPELELKNPQKMLSYLDNEKQLIKAKLENNKADIMKKYQLWEKTLSFFCLALTEQPTYKIATMLFDVGVGSADYIQALQPERSQAISTWFDQLCNEKLPMWIQEKHNPEYHGKIIKNFAGLLCFLGDQGISSWMGYTYRAVTAINRVLFSQFDTWVSLGDKVGLDEMSLLEKETAMGWLSGLSLHLLFQNTNYWMPTFLSYSASTAASFGSVIIIDDLINIVDDLLKDYVKIKEWNPKAIALGKFALQASVYSIVYSSSFKKSLEFFPPVLISDEMTPAKALKTMRFFTEPSKGDLKSRYHELARQYHYDKCMAICHNSDIKAETETTPTKNYPDTNMPSCVESCNANDQTMREINQAYSYLKSSNI